MDKGCPLCNGIQYVNSICPVCFNSVTDGGPVEEYLDPYSPYTEINQKVEDLQEEKCLHLLYCPQCGWDKRKYIDKKSFLGY